MKILTKITTKKYNLLSAVVFFAVALLCILPLRQTVVVSGLDNLTLFGADSHFDAAKSLVIGIVLCSLFFVLQKLVFCIAAIAKHKRATLTATAALVFFCTAFLTIAYPIAWSELIDIATLENNSFGLGAYCIFVLPIALLALMVCDFAYAVFSCDKVLLDRSKITDVEARLFWQNQNQNKSFLPSFCTAWILVYLALVVVSLISLAASYEISFADATQNMTVAQRDSFYFLFKRDHLFSVAQVCFALMIFTNHLLARSAAVSPTQNFARLLYFARLIFVFAYTVIFTTSFPLTCQLAMLFNNTDSLVVNLSYFLHLAMPIVLLSAFWLDVVLSSGKVKNATASAVYSTKRPRALQLIHGVGYGLCSVLAALAVAFPFFIYQAGETTVSIFLHGNLDKSYYPSFLPDGGIGTLTSINTLMVSASVISAFALFVFCCGRIIKRPLFNIYTIMPLITKAITALVYTTLFLYLLDDLQGTREMFLKGTHEGGIFTRHLGWHAASVAANLLLITIWTDAVLSLWLLIRNRNIFAMRLVHRKVSRIEAKVDRVSARLEDAETVELAARKAELEAELEVVRKKLAEKQKISDNKNEEKL